MTIKTLVYTNKPIVSLARAFSKHSQKKYEGKQIKVTTPEDKIQMNKKQIQIDQVTLT